MDYEKMIWELINEELDSRDNKDYAPDLVQMQKLVNAYLFFKKYAKENGGTVEDLNFVPKLESCGVTAYFTLFAPFGDDLCTFQQIMQDISAISIDSLENGDVCISINIPKVFTRE